MAKALDVVYKRRRGKNGAPLGYTFTPLFWAGFGVVHVGVDYNWLYTNMRSLRDGGFAHLGSKEHQLLAAGVYLFAAACAFTVVGNSIVVASLLRRLSRASRLRLLRWRAELDQAARRGEPVAGVRSRPQEFAVWRSNHRTVFACVVLASCVKLSVFPVLHCRAFGLKALSAPVMTKAAGGRPHRDALLMSRRTSLMSAVEDFPQLIATFVVATVNDEWALYSTAAALVMSAVSFLLALLKTVDLVCCTQSLAGDDIHDAGDAARTPPRTSAPTPTPTRRPPASPRPNYSRLLPDRRRRDSASPPAPARYLPLSPRGQAVQRG